MRKQVIGRAGTAQLLPAIERVQAADRVQVRRRRRRPEQGIPGRKRPAWLHDALDPDLLDRVGPPGREYADAVAARHDLVEMRFERRQWQVAKTLPAELGGRAQ